MKTQAYMLHALSPLHAGTGQSVDVIDLPIARMKATGMPYVPGSSVKGVLRDAAQEATRNAVDDKEKNELLAVYGPEQQPEDGLRHAGALQVGDARLLALPLRSFVGTFAWVTSPLLLTLAARDLKESRQAPPTVPTVTGRGAKVSAQLSSVNIHSGKVYLEDIDLKVEGDGDVDGWAKLVAKLVAPEQQEMVTSRFLVVDDETMTYFWETGTQIETRVRLDPETRVVAKGALWMEECLPPETLLIGLMAAERSRRQKVTLTEDQVLEQALKQGRTLQFGGKATVGRGRCRVVPVKG